MAIVQISRIQHRRGYQQDLPQLASAELGWSLDSRRLFIGNGTTDEGAPVEGVTEILTEHSDLLDVADEYTYKGLDSGALTQTGPTLQNPIYRTLQAKLDDIVSVKDFGAKGDGITDDTSAVQRALTNALAVNQFAAQQYHRGILFPAGTYKLTSTLKVPPYTMIVGEGKRSSYLVGDFAGPLVELMDSFGQTGYDFYKANGNGENPYNIDYHFMDIGFWQLDETTRNYPCVVIDGGFGIYFNRCFFGGTKFYASGDGYNNSQCYDIDQGNNVSLINIRNTSGYDFVRDVVISQCDLNYHNYAIEINNAVRGVNITDCFIYDVNKGVIAGNLTIDPAYVPTAISCSNNWFYYNAYNGLDTKANVQGVVSNSNWYTRTGLVDYQASTPLTNPSGLMLYPSISFSAENCFSIGDIFDKNQADYAANPGVPNIDDNGYVTYQIVKDRGAVLGRKTIGHGLTTTLANTSGSTMTANILNLPTGYNNLSLDYTANTGTHQRTGSLAVTNNGSTYVMSDDYSETGVVGLALSANSTTGDIEYSSVSSLDFSYSLNYFKQS